MKNKLYIWDLRKTKKKKNMEENLRFSGLDSIWASKSSCYLTCLLKLSNGAQTTWTFNLKPANAAAVKDLVQMSTIWSNEGICRTFKDFAKIFSLTK